MIASVLRLRAGDRGRWKMSQSLACSAECYRLDEFVRQYASQLPQIVQVVEGFTGTSVPREAINSGEVLVILDVQHERKILARDQDDRELCLSRNCDLKVEIVPNNCKGEYDTLDTVLQAGSRYFRVLYDISRYGLQAGDILQFAPESPESTHSLHCIFVNSKHKDSVDLPKNLNGKFQTLQHHRPFFLDEVLKEFPLPVNVRVAFLGHSAKTGFPESSTPLMESIKSIFLEHEFVEETIFAVAPGFRNAILLFPRTLDLTVSREVSTDVFADRSTAEKLDKLLKGAVYFDQSDRYNMSGINFSKACVRRFPFEVLATHPFSFDKPSSSLTTVSKDGDPQIREDCFGHALNVVSLSEPVIKRNNGKQVEHFEKEPAQSLPGKQNSSAPSQKGQQKKGSGRESRKPSMVKNEVGCASLKTSVEDPTCMRPQQKLVISASSSLSKSGSLMNEKRANEATAHATVDSSETSGTLNYVFEATRNNQDTAAPHSDLLLCADNIEVFCEIGGREPLTRPLPLMKNIPKAANSCQSIPLTKQPNNLSLQPEATCSDLSDKEIDDNINQCVLLEASSVEREDSTGHGLSDASQKSGVSRDPYNGHRAEEDMIRTGRRTCLLNTDNQRKGFLNTFGRKTKSLRHDASKPERKTNKQASNVHPGQPWISKPRPDDFLDMRSIQSYLELRQQLLSAQARIHQLENQTFEERRTTNIKTANDSHMERKNSDEDPQEKIVNREKYRSYSEQQKGGQTTQSLSYNESNEIAIHTGRKCKSDENALRDLPLSKSATKTEHRIQANQDHQEITDKEEEMENELPMDSHHRQNETCAKNDLHFDAQNKDAQNKDALNEDAENEDADNQGAQNQGAQNQDAQKQDAQNENAWNKDAQKEDAQHEDAQEEKRTIGSKERYNDRPSGRRGNDNRRLHRELAEKLPWLCSSTERSVDCLERYRSKEAAKFELKMAILSMTWTEDEWMELSELVRLKRTKEQGKVAHVNLEFHERQVPSPSSHRTYERYLVSSCTGSGQDSGTPRSHGYVNTDLLRQEADDRVFSRATNWTSPENRQMRRKPPIPTPRKGSSPL